MLLVKLKVEIAKGIKQIYFSSYFSLAAILFTIKYILSYNSILSVADENLLKHPLPLTRYCYL